MVGHVEPRKKILCTSSVSLESCTLCCTFLSLTPISYQLSGSPTWQQWSNDSASLWTISEALRSVCARMCVCFAPNGSSLLSVLARQETLHENVRCSHLAECLWLSVSFELCVLSEFFFSWVQQNKTWFANYTELSVFVHHSYLLLLWSIGYNISYIIWKKKKTHIPQQVDNECKALMHLFMLWSSHELG